MYRAASLPGMQVERLHDGERIAAGKASAKGLLEVDGPGCRYVSLRERRKKRGLSLFLGGPCF
jgi:hypothetical protein